MQYGEIPGVKKPVARLIQGSAMISSDLDEAQSFALLDHVYGLGCNTLDTAHVYCGGESERIIGRWVQARGLRQQIVIITKGAAHSQDRRRMTSVDITSDLHDSRRGSRPSTLTYTSSTATTLTCQLSQLSRH